MDLVVEVGGAGTFGKSLQAVRIGGVVAQIGVLTGVEQPVLLTPILHKMIQVKGVYVGSREDFLAMNRALETNKIRPVIDAIVPFAEAPKAFQTLEESIPLRQTRGPDMTFRVIPLFD